MRYIDERIEKEKKVVAEVGDFIFADGDLFVIYKRYGFGKVQYQSICMLGTNVFDGARLTRDSIEEIIGFYKMFEDFELIKSDEMKLVREA